jgi:hypothetical protein
VEAVRHILQFAGFVAMRCGVAALCVIVLTLAFEARSSAQPLIQPPAPAAEPQLDDSGLFEVRRVSTELRNGVYFLNASIAYQLSTEARDALHSGLPLTIGLEVEIFHPRRWWFDNDSAALSVSYQLEYHALSERYIVLNVNSGEQASFASMFAALDYLGTVRRLPLLDAAVLESEREYDARMRVLLDQEEFPGPLRLLAFWRRDWSIASEWYRWQLVRE